VFVKKENTSSRKDLLSALAFLVVFLLYIIFGNSAWGFMIENLGSIKPLSVLIAILVIIIPCVFLFLARNSFLSYLENVSIITPKQSSNFKQKFNFYIIVALILSILTINIGTVYINSQFHVFPVPIVWKNSSINDILINNIMNITPALCNSDFEYETVVTSDRLSCRFSITYSNYSFPYLLQEVEMYSVENNKISTNKTDVVLRETQSEKDNRTKEYVFFVLVPEDDYASYWIRLPFYNTRDSNDYRNLFYSDTFILKDILPREKYNTWKAERIGWFLALFTGILLIVLGGLVNLRRLIEWDNKR